MHRKPALSETHEMYLKVLYQVRAEYEVARVRDISKGLGVNPGTVTSGLKRLEKMGFVDFAGSTVVHSVGGWAARQPSVTVTGRRSQIVLTGSWLHLPSEKTNKNGHLFWRDTG